MPDEKKPEAPTQTTEKGLEVPVPTREDFLRNMDKVSPPIKPKPNDEREPTDER